MKPGNRLKIKSLSKHWADNDVVMLHACFQCLTDCVEKEKLLDGHIDWDATEKHQKAHKKLSKLYKWWATRCKHDIPDDFTDTKQRDTDTKQLIRLIKLRHFLWT